MGHTRKADKAPSPLELLAIFAAKERGMTVPEISQRTKYAKSSIIRWWEKWGSDTAVWEAILCEQPAILEGRHFDDLYAPALHPREAYLADPSEANWKALRDYVKRKAPELLYD